MKKENPKNPILTKKDLSFFIDPIDFLIFVIFFILFVKVILNLTWLQVASFYLLDSVIISLLMASRKHTLKFFDSKVVNLLKFNERYTFKSEREKKDFIEMVFRYPKINTYWVTTVNILKNFIVFLPLIYFFVDPVNATPLILATKYLLFSWLCFSYFHALSYVSQNIYFTKLLLKIHKEHDLTEAFKGHRSFFNAKEKRREFITLTSLVLSMVFLLFTLFELGPVNEPFHLSLFWPLTIGFGCLLRIFWVYRKQDIIQLELTYNEIEEVANNPGSILPLHVDPQMRSFQSSINELSQSLRNKNDKLTEIMLQESSDSITMKMGEISALLAHDLIGPVHAIKFSLNELSENEQVINDSELELHIQNLTKSNERIYTLVNNLRSYLRGKVDKDLVTIHELVLNVKTVLEIEHKRKLNIKNLFSIDESLKSMFIDKHSILISQVFYNILKNSFTVLIKENIKTPKIEIKKGLGNSLLISNNASPISEKLFEDMVNDDIRKYSNQSINHGIGLRLSSSICKQLNGELRLYREESSEKLFFEIDLNAVVMKKIPPLNLNYGVDSQILN